MITYQDLCKQQQKYNQVLIERRAVLREQIRQLEIALAKDLDLLGKTYKKQFNDPAPSEPYVKTANADGVPCEFHQLKAEFDGLNNPNIEFGLILVLEENPATYPKKPVHLNIRAYYCSENLIRLVFIHTDGTPSFAINIDDEEESKFAQIIEAYKQLVLKTYAI